MAEPSKEVFENMAATNPYKPMYVDRYDINEERINPLAKVVPTFEAYDTGNGTKATFPFFGPFVCNVVCFTGPYVRTTDDGGGWDEEAVSKCKDVIKAAYDKFSRYECHFFIDADATAAAAEENEDAMQETEDLIEALCEELSAYGFTYHGRKDAGEISTAINDVIKEFKETIKPDNT